VDGTLTDPLDDDCDDDDYLDGEEIEAGTNPHYEYSHPYTGGYAVGFCDELPDEASAGPTGTGNYGSDNWTAYQAGDVMANYEWIDSYGELVSLYSFCGKTIMMAVSTMWCGPCKTLAAQLPGIQEEYVDQEFTAIEFLTQDNGGARPDVDDLVQWRDTYELDGIPVVAQERAAVWKKFFDADGYVPSTIIIGPDMTVLSMDEGIHDPAAFLD